MNKSRPHPSPEFYTGLLVALAFALPFWLVLFLLLAELARWWGW